MEEKQEKIREDLETAQEVNKAIGDVPEEVEFGGRTFKLSGFTIKRILEIDNLIIELTNLFNSYSALRSRAEVDGLDAVREELIKTGQEVADKMAEIVARILSAGSTEEVSKEWVMENLDPTPTGNGIKVLEAYRRKCNLLPFLEAILGSKQF